MVPLEFSLGFMLKNIDQLSLEDMGNAALPTSPVVSSCSIAWDIHIGEWCGEANFVAHALNIFEGVSLARGLLQKYLVLILFQCVFRSCLVSFKSYVIFENQR